GPAHRTELVGGAMPEEAQHPTRATSGDVERKNRHELTVGPGARVQHQPAIPTEVPPPRRHPFPRREHVVAVPGQLRPGRLELGEGVDAARDRRRSSYDAPTTRMTAVSVRW